MSELRPDEILKVGMGFFASKTLLSAVEMGVFTELAGRAEPFETLQGRLGLHARGARDFLDALVALKFLERHDGLYRNSPTAEQFLDRHKSAYIGGILEMANSRLFPSWAHLTDSLRTGLPHNENVNRDVDDFTALYADPARLKQFLRAMTGVSRGANQAIARKFPWYECKTAVDVGTAQGDLITQICLANPNIEGTGFDLPAVAPIFEEYVAANGLASRIKFAPGSFFENPLPKADVVMMGHILHDWPLETKRMLIRKAYEALSPGGAFIVYESIIDDDRSTNAFGLLMSLNMLVKTQGGFDYTAKDCIGWMKEAGFRETEVTHLVGPDSMVVAIK